MKHKQVKDYDNSLFSDIDWSVLNFIEDFNQGPNRTLYDKLYTHYYEYFLVFAKERLQAKIQMRLDEESDYLNELYATTQYEYNPIENYNMKEESEDNANENSTSNRTLNATDNGTVKHTGTENTEGTFSNRDTGTDTLTATGTENKTSTHTGNETVDEDVTNSQTGSVFPMTISTSKDKEKTDGATNTDSTRTLNLTDSDETTKDLTDTHTLNLIHSGNDENVKSLDLTDTSQNTRNETDNVTDEKESKITHKLTRAGNIGVTTTQQMIESQRKVLMCMFKQITLILNDYFFLDDDYLD